MAAREENLSESKTTPSRFMTSPIDERGYVDMRDNTSGINPNTYRGRRCVSASRLINAAVRILGSWKFGQYAALEDELAKAYIAGYRAARRHYER